MPYIYHTIIEIRMNPIQVSFLGLLLCSFTQSLSSAETTKPGECPPERFYIKRVESQPMTCTYDSDCPGDKKCCKDNESKFCKPPAKVRSGSCPTNPHKTVSYEPCNDGCTSDSECAPGSKCCFTKCGRICTPSVGEKKGFCKVEVPKIYCLIAQRPICNDDTSCPNNEKCCLHGCGNNCEVPQTVRTKLLGEPHPMNLVRFIQYELLVQLGDLSSEGIEQGLMGCTLKQQYGEKWYMSSSCDI
ncbi:WAP four-disulfide core domain protein 3 [Leptodactylus fuscus]|uniref:uncharacterized protein LOC142210088 n=1 Tax=Leptodactylus fuscus TaxID=238119 RepID=UPI003F4E57AA